jgi:hypothetical protein
MDIDEQGGQGEGRVSLNPGDGAGRQADPTPTLLARLLHADSLACRRPHDVGTSG